MMLIPSNSRCNWDENSPGPLFVIGCMRSGTTLLYRLLTRHPQLLYIDSELNDEWHYQANLPCGHGKCEPRYSHDVQSGDNKLLSGVFQKSIHDSMTLMGFGKRLVNRYKFEAGNLFPDWKRIIPVNKSPHLMNKIGYLNTVFPHSRFILIVRSLYAHTASMKMFFTKLHYDTNLVFHAPRNQAFCWGNMSLEDVPNNETYYPRNFDTIPEMWIRLNKVAMQDLEQVDVDRRIIVSYEDLVSDQACVLRQIFELLQLDSIHYNSEVEICNLKLDKKNTSTDGDPIQKWKSYLTPSEIKQIEQVKFNRKNDLEFILQNLGRSHVPYTYI